MIEYSESNILRLAQAPNLPFAMCSPFDSKPVGAKPQPKLVSKEEATLVANKNQIVTFVIPYNTTGAPHIRGFMHGNVLVNNQRIFIYRAQSGWTNVALDSTADEPKLTCDPYLTLYTAYNEMNKCEHILRVNMRWADGTPINIDDVNQLEFDPLPSPSSDPEPTAPSLTGPSAVSTTTSSAASTAPVKAVEDKLNVLDEKVNMMMGLHGNLVATMQSNDDKMSAQMDKVLEFIMDKKSNDTPSPLANEKPASAPSTPTANGKKKAKLNVSPVPTPSALMPVSAALPELPEDAWRLILSNRACGLWAGKALRRVARINRLFAAEAATHPDNAAPLAA